MTPEQIEAQLREENPFTRIDGQTYTSGDPEYEAKIAEWKEAAIAHQAAIEEEMARKVWPSVQDFWEEFTDAEALAIQTSSAPEIIVARSRLAMWRGQVWSDDVRVTGGLAALEAAEILSEARVAEILG